MIRVTLENKLIGLLIHTHIHTNEGKYQNDPFKLLLCSVLLGGSSPDIRNWGKYIVMLLERIYLILPP